MSHLRRLRPVPRRRSGRALLVAGLLMLAGAGGGVALAASQPKPGIDVRVSPASQSVPRGGPATYTIWLSSTGGFAGTVALSASGLPSGSSAAFAPASVTLTASGSASTATTNLTVTTTSTTPIGTKTLTIKGTSGKVSGSVDAGLTVNYPLSSSISMTSTPATVMLEPGATANYAIALTRTNLPGTVTFSVSGGLPTGATASFSPNPTTGNNSALQIATKSSTPEGSSTLHLVASGNDPGGTTRYAYASVELVVDKGGRPFTISGSVTGLAPGLSQPLNLTLSNPNKKALSVSNLGVTITQVTRAAGVTMPCGTGDYAVTQYAGPYPVTVPANGSISLSQLTVPSSVWPKVTMLNRPVNQDGCKGARLTLTYSGSGYGG